MGLPNPASAYCQGLGFREETRADEDGQFGVCVFPDGSECDTWDFLSGRCGQQHSYCAQQGYTLEEGTNIGTCVFPDGASCSELDFFQGRCKLENLTNPVEEQDQPDEEEVSAQVSEAPRAGIAVIGWLVAVYRLPDGAQFDYYVVLVPEEAGSFGIFGADESVEFQIVSLRDHPEPRKYANFWGTLNCEVPDYYGWQLLVSRLRAGTETSGPECIEGWAGKIYSHPAGMQFDDYFILEGEYPVQFGIASSIDEGGWPLYAEALESLRDTGQTIRVSGRLMCGVPNTNGCQIQVSRLEVESIEIQINSN